MYVSAGISGLCVRKEIQREGNHKKADCSFRRGTGTKQTGSKLQTPCIRTEVRSEEPMSNRNYDRGYAARPSGRTHTGGNRSYGNEHGTGKSRYAADRYEYWYGSEAPVLEPWEEEPQPARRMPSKHGKTGAQNRSRAKHKNLMNPALIVFILCQKQIYSGLTQGAVKG